MCVTSFSGTLLMSALFWRRTVDAVAKGGMRFLAAVFAVAALSAAYNYHFIAGLKFFNVSDGAFATCMTVITMPFVMLAARRRISAGTWMSTAIVSSGIIVVLGPSLRASNIEGLVVLLAGCVLCSVVTLLLADLVKKHDPLAVAVLREGTMSVLAFAMWFSRDAGLFASLPASRTLFAAWALYTYFVVVLALVLNVFAMRHVSAANATIVYSLQVVFSLLLGIALPAGIVEGFELSPRVLAGAGLVVVGSVAEIAGFCGKRRETRK